MSDDNGEAFLDVFMVLCLVIDVFFQLMLILKKSLQSLSISCLEVAMVLVASFGSGDATNVIFFGAMVLSAALAPLIHIWTRMPFARSGQSDYQSTIVVPYKLCRIVMPAMCWLRRYSH